MSLAPIPFLTVALVLLLAIAGLDAHHPCRSAAMSFRDVLLIAALHFALAARVLIAALTLARDDRATELHLHHLAETDTECDAVVEDLIGDDALTRPNTSTSGR